MDVVKLTSEISLHGMNTICLENNNLRVVMLPEAGARIWQIVYKPFDAELLWNNPNVVPAKHGVYASYDEVWSGGWDELFPNDEAGTLLGNALPDHGELWTGSWQAEPFQSEDEVGVHLRLVTPISNFLAEKTVRLRAERCTLEIDYRLTNQGRETFPFLWKLHPAFAVSSSHRIDFPPMAVLLEPDFPGTLVEAPPIFQWPYAPLGDKVLDMRQVPDVTSHALHFFYGTGLASGWCGVTNKDTRLGCALRFDPEVFSSCWLFASHGGWKDLNVAVLEPATGYPFQIQSLIDRGRARHLAPGESLATTVLFSVQEGLTSIGGVEESGRILGGDDS